MQELRRITYVSFIVFKTTWMKTSCHFYIIYIRHVPFLLIINERKLIYFFLGKLHAIHKRHFLLIIDRDFRKWKLCRFGVRIITCHLMTSLSIIAILFMHRFHFHAWTRGTLNILSFVMWNKSMSLLWKNDMLLLNNDMNSKPFLIFCLINPISVLEK